MEFLEAAERKGWGLKDILAVFPSLGFVKPALEFLKSSEITKIVKDLNCDPIILLIIAGILILSVSFLCFRFLFSMIGRGFSAVLKKKSKKKNALQSNVKEPKQQSVRDGLLAAMPKDPEAGTRFVLKISSINYVFRWCPPGTFVMGAPEDECPELWDEEYEYDEHLHEVTLTKGFWMLETQVTQAMWESVMGTTVRQQRDKEDPDALLCGEGAEYPIYYVNWEESRTFCEKLSSKLGVQVSLPTEAQWEYACRAGTTGAYAGNLDAMAWYDEDWGTGSTHPVGQKKANEWGLYDMHGNVWEWCSDWYASDYYVESPTSDPIGPNRGSYRVDRGGSWYGFAEGCRSAYRNCSAPGFRYRDLGFRIVLAESDK